MKIVHICLANFYVDGMAYQENLLPKYHSMNHDVCILTSDYSFDPTGKVCRKKEKEYRNEYGIPVKVLDRSKRFGVYSKYRNYEHLRIALQELQPDIIFCHGGQFVSLRDVVWYCKKNAHVKLFIDQHGDYYNTPVNTLKRRLAQYLIFGFWMRKAAKYTKMFWGVTPWRCQYLEDVYHIPKEKIGLLVMGGDDEKIQIEKQETIRREVRARFNIADTDFLVVTGGKIDKTKNIHLIVQALKEINSTNIKLIVFGQPSVDFEEEFLKQVGETPQVHYIGWIPSDTVYDYFHASDLVMFPGTHSVLWEQACACGIPGVFRHWEGMHHVDVGGNAMFLYEDSVEEIKRVLLDLYMEPETLGQMREVAREKGISMFSYRAISQRAIFEDDSI